MRATGNGGCVIRYEGKRGMVWRIKYADAGGKQVMETVGAERDGVTERGAHELLERRRVEVRDDFSKPEAVSFAKAAQQWFETDESRAGGSRDCRAVPTLEGRPLRVLPRASRGDPAAPLPRVPRLGVAGVVLPLTGKRQQPLDRAGMILAWAHERICEQTRRH